MKRGRRPSGRRAAWPRLGGLASCGHPVDGSVQVEDEDELANRLAGVWLESADDNDAQVARRFIETRRGATRRQLELLKGLVA